MRIKNDELKDLVNKKIELAKKGSEIYASIEAKMLPMVSEHLVSKGLTSELRDNQYYFTGTYQQLLSQFSAEGQSIIDSMTDTAFADDFKELKKLEYQIQKTQEDIIPIINELVIPSLKDFEEIGKITVVDDEVDVEIYSALETWKERWLELHRK